MLVLVCPFFLEYRSVSVLFSNVLPSFAIQAVTGMYEKMRFCSNFEKYILENGEGANVPDM